VKKLTVKFCAAGWIEQEIEVEDEIAALGKDTIEEMLTCGQLATSLQDGGEVISFTGQFLNKIGTVLNVDNNLEYQDFEVTYDD